MKMKQITLELPKRIRNHVSDQKFKVLWNAKPDELELFLYGMVGDEYEETDAASISRLLSKHRGKPVTMRINSEGGLAYDGLAIFNALAGHDAPTTAIVESLAASAASLAAVGANTVKMHANATFMIHEGLAIAMGHAAEIRDTLEWLESFNASAAETYSARSTMTVEETRAALLGPNGDGTKYTAAEAKAVGFVDEVIELPAKKKAAARAMAEAEAMEERAVAVGKDLAAQISHSMARLRLTETRRRR